MTVAMLRGARRRRRRHRRQPVGGRAGPDRGPRRGDRARPLQRGAVPGPGRHHRRHASPSATGPRSTTQPGDDAARRPDPMGCEVSLDGTGLDRPRLRRDPRRRPRPARRRRAHPGVAALCALADSPSHLRGIGHIRGHETDRLAALATELGRARRRRHRAPRRAVDPARAAARRRLPDVRRPPDGPRRRHHRLGRRRRAGRGHRHHVQDLPRLRRRLAGPRGMDRVGSA